MINHMVMKLSRILWLPAWILMMSEICAQPTPVTITPNVRLPKDSVESRLLMSSLNKFLQLAEGNNTDNSLVLAEEQVETFVLLDELKGVERSQRFLNEHFFLPYLTNVVSLDPQTFLIQLAFMGVSQEKTILRGSFTLLAHKKENTFLFSSPLRRNTRLWNITRRGRIWFYYPGKINRTKVKEYEKYVSGFDAKLRVKPGTTNIYCGGNMVELLKLIGVDYKSDYNGRSTGVFSASGNNMSVLVLGNNNASFDQFDPHDLWHDRLGLVVARSSVNKPVDEGCAYLYGGSWGYSWHQIFDEFRKFVAEHPDIDWAAVKEEPVNFKTGAFNNPVDYIVNALLVKRIEREKGFEGVWELLNCGKFEKGNEVYYRTLEKLTGITRAKYNEEVWSLIKSEK